jgi:hypothetical protein
MNQPIPEGLPQLAPFSDASTIEALLTKLRSTYSHDIDVLDERFVYNAVSTAT